VTLGTVCPNVVGETKVMRGKNRRFAGKRSGARRIRTADLLGAIQALCQLSYSPEMADLQGKPATERVEQRGSLAWMCVVMRRWGSGGGGESGSLGALRVVGRDVSMECCSVSALLDRGIAGRLESNLKGTLDGRR
jgi:hypothetical protein